MGKYFVTFADKRLIKSLNRISKQADNLFFFDKSFVFNEDDLPSSFNKKFKSRLIPGSRGFGFWCWKPAVIKMALDQISDQDMLLYVDAGCHLNKNGLSRLNEYFQILKSSKKGIIAFQGIPPRKNISRLNYDGRELLSQENYKWIKGDLFKHFNVENDRKFTHSQAIGAGVILIKKSNESIKLINEWQNIIVNDFSLLDNTQSISPNFEGFIEHRHDQAIFSLLCLKYDIETLSAYEYWYPKKKKRFGNFWPDWQALYEFPIHAKRDKDLGFLPNIVFKVSLYLKRVVNVLFNQ